MHTALVFGFLSIPTI